MNPTRVSIGDQGVRNKAVIEGLSQIWIDRIWGGSIPRPTFSRSLPISGRPRNGDGFDTHQLLIDLALSRGAEA